MALRATAPSPPAMASQSAAPFQHFFFFDTPFICCETSRVRVRSYFVKSNEIYPKDETELFSAGV